MLADLVGGKDELRQAVCCTCLDRAVVNICRRKYALVGSNFGASLNRHAFFRRLWKVNYMDVKIMDKRVFDVIRRNV